MKWIFTLLFLLSFSSFTYAKKISEFNKNEVAAFLSSYSNLVLSNYEKTVNSALDLQKSVELFLNDPTEEKLNSAKIAWVKARYEYSKTEAYRFYGGPIDAPETGPEGLINSWPLDESYIDYVKGNEKAGIINSNEKYPLITKELLVSLNEKDGEVNIATGYHAVEFLLWGQDLSITSAGKRSIDDYIAAKNQNAQRRKTYLKLTLELLVENLKSVKKEWEGEKYLQILKKDSDKMIVQKIVLGLTSLSFDEMSGERMTVAFAKKDQENEQDCFSDNSLNDLVANQEGIIEVFEKTDLKNLFHDQKMANMVSKQMKSNLDDLKSVKGPFDSIVSNPKNSERKIVKKIISNLQLQARLLNKLGKSYGLELNVQ
jgi:putative iron-regulated protein